MFTLHWECTPKTNFTGSSEWFGQSHGLTSTEVCVCVFISNHCRWKPGGWDYSLSVCGLCPGLPHTHTALGPYTWFSIILHNLIFILKPSGLLYFFLCSEPYTVWVSEPNQVYVIRQSQGHRTGVSLRDNMSKASVIPTKRLSEPSRKAKLIFHVYCPTSSFLPVVHGPAQQGMMILTFHPAPPSATDSGVFYSGGRILDRV